jgi:hypothetical protein
LKQPGWGQVWVLWVSISRLERLGLFFGVVKGIWGRGVLGGEGLVGENSEKRFGLVGEGGRWSFFGVSKKVFLMRFGFWWMSDRQL